MNNALSKKKKLQEYWKTYCELAIKKLENFNDVFNVQLDQQIKLLNEVLVIMKIE